MQLRLSALDGGEAEHIIDQALQMLFTTGMRMAGTRALDDLRLAGANVDSSGLVRFPPGLVTDAIAACPRDVLLAGAAPAQDTHVFEGGTFHFLPGGCAAFTLDTGTGVRRPSTLADLCAATALLDEMSQIDVMYTVATASDVDAERRSVTELCAMLTETRKHVVCVDQPPPPASTGRLIDAVAGGRAEFLARPRFSTLCTTASPLTVDGRVLDLHLHTAGLGAPVFVYTLPLAGATSPVTLAGTITQGLAEFLGVATAVQTARPGAPVVFCFGAGVLDMRHGTAALGSLEGSVMGAAAIDIGHRLGVPVLCPGLATDAKHSGIQAGYEKALKLLAVAAAGVDLTTGGVGLLDGANTLSFAQIVLDNEIAEMVRAMLRPVRITADTEMSAAVERVGPGGSYLADKETRRRVRDGEHFMPKVATRRPYEQWLAAGVTEADVALRMARDILDARAGRGPYLSEDQARELAALSGWGILTLQPPRCSDTSALIGVHLGSTEHLSGCSAFGQALVVRAIEAVALEVAHSRHPLPAAQHHPRPRADPPPSSPRLAIVLSHVGSRSGMASTWKSASLHSRSSGLRETTRDNGDGHNRTASSWSSALHLTPSRLP